MKGDYLSGRISVTKTNVAMVGREKYCQSCSKSLPPSTKRRRFCDDTCRQAGYRSATGKSAKAGSQRVKTPVPFRAGKGLPKTLEDWYREIPIIQTAVRNRYGGVIEVYHQKHGRGVLDLFRPIHDAQRHGSKAWKQPRCLFNKPKLWRYLDWQYVYLLKWHERDCRCDLPKNLRWIHQDPNRRMRRNRIIHIDFSKIGVHFDADKQCYTLTREPAVNVKRDVLIELTEDTGKHNDEKQPQIIPLENLNSTDEDGSAGTNGSKR